MEVCLSHWSALQTWRHVRSLSPSFTQSTLTQHLPMPKNLGFTATPQEVISLKSNYGFTKIDAIVYPRARRHQRLGVNIHCFSAQKNPVTLAAIEPGLFITSPECIFMHLSGKLSIIGLIALGYELCSIYTIGVTGSIDVSTPLTTVEQLENALSLAINKKRAEKALAYIQERSRSPRETEAAMKLMLPFKLGGFKQQGMRMNEPVVLSEDSQSICNKHVCYPDMLFPHSKLVFEYDGKEFHQGREQEDELRRIALANDGYQVKRITHKELRNRLEMRRLANIASVANTGRSLRINTKEWKTANENLFLNLKNGVHVDGSAIWKARE